MTTANEGKQAPAETAGNAAPIVNGDNETILTGDPDQLNIGSPVNLNPPAPTPKAPDTVSKDDVGEFGDAGDPAMNIVYRFVEKLGFKAGDTEIQSVLNSGDFTLLRAKLASMGDKAQGWQEYVSIAERHFNAQEQKKQENILACENAIHAAVGGKEQWLQIQAWASANADEHEKETFNALLNSGPLQAKAAARQLAEYFYNAHGNVKDPADAVSEQASSAGSGNAFALSPQQYVAAVQDLARKVGAGRIDDHPEYAKLKQRRAAWRG